MIVMLPIGLPTLYRRDRMIVRLDALYKSHIKNHDISQWLLMGNTGAYTSWALLTLLPPTTTPYRASCGWRMTMCSLDMATGVMLGTTISATIGIDKQ
jgi:hypothetical protein